MTTPQLADQPMTEKTAQRTLHLLSHLRILVVDDNMDSVDSLSLLLKLMGNEVRTAHDGVEAVETAEAFEPDLVLLDIDLPRMNGLDAARQIRARRGRSVVIIAVTGLGKEEDRRRSMEAGFDQHMTKPIDVALLRALLVTLNGHGTESHHPHS